MHKPAYSWLTFWASMLFIIILGFSRLSYGLFLPTIQRVMGGTYGELGMLGALNFVGYFIGTLFLPVMLSRFSISKRRLNGLASLLLGITMMGSGLSGNLVQLGIWRLLIGLLSAISTVLVLSLTLDRIQPSQRGTASGLIWMGGSAGIAVSGFVAPSIISPIHPFAWRIAWLAMGLFGVLSSVGFETLLNRIQKVNTETPYASLAGEKKSTNYQMIFSPRKLLFLALSYFLYGWSYIVYFTYLIPYLVKHGVPPIYAGLVWSAIGFAGMFNGFIGGKAIDRWPSGFTLSIGLAIGTVGAISVLTDNLTITFIGGMLIGMATFLSPPVMTSALLRRELSAASYASILSTFSALFAAGQMIGPLIGGWTVDQISLQAGIASSAITMLFSAGFAVAYGGTQRLKIPRNADTGLGKFTQSNRTRE